MNITLPVIIENSKTQETIEHITFYQIYAIAPAENNKCFIHTNGTKYLCTLSFEEVWDKLKQYEKSI
jgi:hypothetical protein